MTRRCHLSIWCSVDWPTMMVLCLTMTTLFLLLPTDIKMKIALLTITVAVYTHAVGAFVPKSGQFTDMKTSFDAMMKPLKSSRAEPVVSETTAAETRTATGHKRWGVDNTNEEEYWNDSRIHTLGNNGFFGAVSSWLLRSWESLFGDRVL